MMAIEDIGIPIREMWGTCGRKVTLSLRVSDKNPLEGGLGSSPSWLMPYHSIEVYSNCSGL